MTRLRSKILSPVLLPAAGCAGIQSALDPHGPEAAAIAQSHWIMLAGGAAILLVVMALALYAVFRDPARRAPSATAVIVGGGVVFPVVALSALLVYGVSLSSGLRAGEEGALEIEVVAHRWWWEVRYPGASGGAKVATANELRIPVGRAVAVRLTSADVVHSFWIPALAGKIDAIPGRENRIVLRADRPGSFRGQCAEFCGAQHARMALHAVALAPEEFERWLANLQRPVPASAREARGAALFRAHCLECHAVRGLGAAGPRLAAPDLTHVASRAWLGAGTLENNRANLAAWIAANDRLKPGNAMPVFAHLAPGELDALAAWLESLE